MGSAVPEEDSSLASANPSFAVAAARDAGGGVLRIALEPLAPADKGGGKWLYLRKEYLLDPNGGGAPPLAALLFEEPAVAFPILLKSEETELLFRAARAFEAERAAERYLSRAEHSRFLLERKLIKKGFPLQEAAPALDFLKAEKTLDDGRFALAWLNTRAALHPEGKAALFAALLERGVSRETAAAAISAFFELHNEEELCLRAAEKLIRRGRSSEKLISSLVSRGFPLNMALCVAKESLKVK